MQIHTKSHVPHTGVGLRKREEERERWKKGNTELYDVRTELGKEREGRDKKCVSPPEVGGEEEEEGARLRTREMKRDATCSGTQTTGAIM